MMNNNIWRATLLLLFLVTGLRAQAHRILMRDATRNLTVESLATLTKAGALAGVTTLGAQSGAFSSTVVTPLLQSQPATDLAIRAVAGQTLRIQDDVSTDMLLIDPVTFTTRHVAPHSVFSDFTLKAPATLVISGGVVTATQVFLAIDTEGAAATDDLDTITPASGTTVGTIVYVQGFNPPARVVTLKDGTGNLELGIQDISLNANTLVALIWTGSVWNAWVGRAGNFVSGPVPGLSVDNAFVRWDTLTGRIIQNSGSLLFDDGTALFESNLISMGVLEAGRSLTNTETTSGTVYFNGRAGNRSLAIDARTQSGTDATNRDSLSFFGPGSPALPASVEMARATTAEFIMPVGARVEKFFGLGINESVVIAPAATTFAVTKSTASITGDAGGNVVDSITATGIETGDLLIIIASVLGGGITLTDAVAPGADVLNLNGNWVPLAGESLVLRRRAGGEWVELSRSQRNPNSAATNTGDFTTTSATYVTITGSTLTLPAGTWSVTFGASGSSDSSTAVWLVALHNAGAIIQHTEREVDQGAASDDVSIGTQAIVTLAASATIDARAQTSGGTLTLHERSLQAIRLN